MAGRDRLDNVAPKVHATKSRERANSNLDDDTEDPLDAREIFDYIRDINDPEHPYTLEQLNVVDEDLITVDLSNEDMPVVDVSFTPTIPHCSLAALIGLTIVIKLHRSLAQNVKTRVHVTPGSHSTEETINRQLADKERVAAAFENPGIMEMVNRCLKPME